MLDSLQVITKISPGVTQLKKDIALFVDKFAPQFGLNDKAKAAFLAQAGHETAGFKTLTEYASGAAYEGRKDLGNTQPGDGVKYKGRGIFQTTGRNNYLSVSKKIFGDDRLLSKPELLTIPEYAVLSAFHYWKERNLSEIANKPDTWRSNPVKIGGVMKALNPFEYITYRINGGLNGTKERDSFYSVALGVVKNNPVATIVGIVGGGWLLSEIFK